MNVRPFKVHHLRACLIGLIVAASILRLAICLFYNPLDFVFSDASRHWTNGEKLFHPNLMGKCDPLPNQIFVFLVQKITGSTRPGVGLVYGLLSVLMPWTFYRAARELGFSQKRSLATWALIAWTPSLAVIFHYIMIEPLLLPLEGVSLWMTARYLRKGTTASFLVAAGCWSITCLTKPTAVVLGLTCMAYVWWRRSRQMSLLLQGCALVFLLFLIPGMRSYHYLGFVAPTGSHWTPEILHKSDAKRIRIDAGADGHWGFSSPSCYETPLWPLSPWMIHRARTDSTVFVTVDLKNGPQDWQAADAKLVRRWPIWFRQETENIALFLFAPSWPDSNDREWEGWINDQSRWMWAPFLIFVLAFDLIEFLHGHFDLLPIAVTALSLVLLFQNAIDMEGRYRKPLEPLLFLNLLCLGRRSSPGSKPALMPTV